MSDLHRKRGKEDLEGDLIEMASAGSTSGRRIQICRKRGRCQAYIASETGGERLEEELIELWLRRWGEVSPDM